jgi:formate hydrogenlyase subunit 3/multisubunit Na+/H+ antiporter MnhD subunit
MFTTLIKIIFTIIFVAAISPLMEGYMRKIKARIHSRQGPPIYQPYLDIFKLLGKEDLRASNNPLFMLAPLVCFGSVLTASLFVAYGYSPALGHSGDMITFVYLITLSSVAIFFGGLASSNPYADIGSSRELMMLFTVEPVLIITLIVASVKARSMIMSQLPISSFSISMMIAAIGFFLTIQAQMSKLPFDMVQADHSWLPDAHAKAPTPISALLSGLVIKIGAYAFLRTVTIFAPHYKGIVLFGSTLACISMFLGILLAFSQDDIKSLLAFSSISQISYIFCAFSLGSYLGIYAGIFHLLNHAILKSLLFLSVGAIIYATGSRKMSRLHCLSKKMPITSFCFLVGALGIGGMPIFSGFQSKFAIFVALADQGLWLALGIAIATSIMTISLFAWTSYRILWSNPHNHESNSHESKEVPFVMWAPMLVLSGMVILVGLYPQAVYPLVNRATQVILDIIKGVTL